MQYRLKLSDGSHVDLLFSMYFLNRVCKLTNNGLSTIFPFLLGDISSGETGTVSGGILDDLEIRAAVIAAGMEAEGFARGEYETKTLVDGFQVSERVESSLNSPQWVDLFGILTKSLIASLPKDGEPVKKKTVRTKK